MKIFGHFLHLFTPQKSNNHKAKILHSDSLLVVAIFILLIQLLLNHGTKNYSSILGYASQIPPSAVISLTNQQRKLAGLPPLSENSLLDNAAAQKARDMLNKGYWAHIAPDGTTPWQFFANVGYQYRYAGENLARDFSTPDATINAWMASTSHRENILSAKYKEIGVAVIDGSLAGTDTTLVVQLFGSPLSETPAVAPVAAKTNSASPAPVAAPKENTKPVENNEVAVQVNPTSEPSLSIAQNISNSSSKISPLNVTKALTLSILGILSFVFVTDEFLVHVRKVSRIGGRTVAHLSFLGMVIVIVVIIRSGNIL